VSLLHLCLLLSLPQTPRSTLITPPTPKELNAEADQLAAAELVKHIPTFIQTSSANLTRTPLDDLARD